VHRG
jgi:hypothetical protein